MSITRYLDVARDHTHNNRRQVDIEGALHRRARLRNLFEMLLKIFGSWVRKHMMIKEQTTNILWRLVGRFCGLQNLARNRGYGSLAVVLLGEDHIYSKLGRESRGDTRGEE